LLKEGEGHLQNREYQQALDSLKGCQKLLDRESEGFLRKVPKLQNIKERTKEKRREAIKGVTAINKREEAREKYTEAESLFQSQSYVEGAKVMSNSAESYEEVFKNARELGDQELGEGIQNELNELAERIEEYIDRLPKEFGERVDKGRKEVQKRNYDDAAEILSEGDEIREISMSLKSSIGVSSSNKFDDISGIASVLEEPWHFQTIHNRRVAGEFEDTVREDILLYLDRKKSKSKKVEHAVNIADRSLRLSDEHPTYPFSDVVKRLTNYIKEGDLKVEVLDRERTIIERTDKILNFLDTVNESHPSVSASDWRNAIQTALETGSPQTLRPASKQIERMGETLWEKEYIMAFSPEEFEHLVGAVFDDMGYETAVTQKASDGGVDVWAQRNGERVAIQVKQFSDGNSVGRPTLQKISSTIAKGDAHSAVVVTSGEFANTAEQYAHDFGSNMELINGDELLKLLSESDLPPPVSK